MKKKLTAIVASVCAVALAVAVTGCGGSSQLQFVTGGESGTYYAYGTVLAQYATNNSDVTVNALSGNGSKANVEALQDGEADIAFCQSDVLSYAYNGTNTFDGAAYQDFSIVAALYQEQVQIVTCDTTIQTVADLKGKTVSIGATGSGVTFNATDILAAYDMTVNDINAVYQDFGDSASSLQDGKIDAAFIVAGAPTTAITNLSTTKTAYLVSMDDEHVAKLVASSPYYAKATIPAATYGLESDTTTVAVLAVIIANNSVDQTSIYNFTKSIFEGAVAQPEAHAKYQELDLATAVSITNVPYHSGAAKYYEEVGQTIASIAE